MEKSSKRLKVQHHKATVDKVLDSQDVRPLLSSIRDRYSCAGVELPTIEARFEALQVEAPVSTGARALPSVAKRLKEYLQAPLKAVGIKFGRQTELPILRSMSGVLQPGRFKLLLGPPGSGKSTLLKALSGKLEANLRAEGEITLNGHTHDEFTIQRTAAYVEQRDVHIGELSVRETLDFAARVQSVGHKSQMLAELREREKAKAIVPDPSLVKFMESEARPGTRHSAVTELMLRLLGLDYVANTLIGGGMVRGISGGQRKRVTSGEMLVGPYKMFLMDEISTGLDSSTTFQLTHMLADFAHIMQATLLVALLQPAPEVYEQFDDIMLLSEGVLVFHGPREQVLPYFRSMGFKLPKRKGVADFLQEVTSRKDQWQYWCSSKPYRFVPVSDFAEAFQRTQAAEHTRQILAMPLNREASPPGALRTEKYALPRKGLMMAMLHREWILIERNSFIYIFRLGQIILNALLAGTLFLRTTIRPDSLQEANYYLGVLFFSLSSMLFNNWAEFELIVERLPVFFKQRDNRFYPSWSFELPTILFSIPHSLIESAIWSGIVYWVVGFQPSGSGWSTFWLINFLMHQFSTALFRLIGAACVTSVLANATAVLVTLLLFIDGGFVIARTRVRWWWRWLFYINPISWAQRSMALNEFNSARWQRPLPAADASYPGETLGHRQLADRDFENSQAWLWSSIAFIVGSIVILHVLVIICLAWHQAPGATGGSAVISEEELAERRTAVQGKDHSTGDVPAGISTVAIDLVDGHSHRAWRSSRSMSRARSTSLSQDHSYHDRSGHSTVSSVSIDRERRAQGLPAYQNDDIYDGDEDDEDPSSGVLTFDQLWLTFHHVWYSVDLPPGRDPTPGPPLAEGAKPAKPRLYLLSDVSGAFRPRVLTALVGETGAGKTTLMDVLAGRNTGGVISGDIRVQGHPKQQETFARVTGYCEQNDIHSPQTTVREALIFSGALRLPRDASIATVKAFAAEVMEIVELTPLQHALVGLAGQSGLSVEQRKRLTIAVELVANPSIVFMDEPTSGLDARAAAVVMRTVRNTVNTGRTVVCTIHQPSIDIFEAFDDLLLMKRGGRVIFHGPLGPNSCHLINYFSGFEGVAPIADGYNPATWVLEVTQHSQEERLSIDFADAYQSSELYQRTEELVDELSVPPPGSQPLSFPTRYSRPFSGQLLTCLWKNNAVYWRMPSYNAVRFLFTLVFALVFGTQFFAVGRHRTTDLDILTVSGALFASNLFLGVFNAASIQPIVSVERSVFYRERAAGMYSALPYSVAQGLIELPYILVQCTIFVAVVYSMISFEWTAAKFFWFFLFELQTLILFSFYGIVSVSLTPNLVVATTVSGGVYFLMELFSGYIIQAPEIPGWWIWLYYLNPVSWILYGTVVSQLGDVSSTMTLANGGSLPVSKYILDHFGFHHEFLGLCVTVLAGMTLLYWLLTTWSLAKLNWERR